jgi:hypothetical protein
MSKQFYIECIDSDTNETTENIMFFADTEEFSASVVVEFMSQCFNKEED